LLSLKYLGFFHLPSLKSEETDLVVQGSQRGHSLLQRITLALVVSQAIQCQAKVVLSPRIFWIVDNRVAIQRHGVLNLSGLQVLIRLICLCFGDIVADAFLFPFFEGLQLGARLLSLSHCPQHGSQLKARVAGVRSEFESNFHLLTRFGRLSELGQDKAEVVPAIVVVGF
jgi:hypothetical protein